MSDHATPAQADPADQYRPLRPGDRVRWRALRSTAVRTGTIDRILGDGRRNAVAVVRQDGGGEAVVPITGLRRDGEALPDARGAVEAEAAEDQGRMF